MVSGASAAFSGTSGMQAKQATPRLTVVLDMDECLIHSVFEEDHGYRQHEERPDGKAAAGQCEKFPLTMLDGGKCVVNKRPGLDKFLDECMTKYDTYVFTAGLELYASPLLDVLDPDNRLAGRLYRQHCKHHRGYYLKDLTVLPSDIKRTVLVDNNVISFGVQPSNGIPVPNFYTDANDNHLEDVMRTLDMRAETEEDVRPQLDGLFNLEEQLHGWRVQVGLDDNSSKL